MKKRTIRRKDPRIKNGHLIGAGAKFKPVYTNKGKINFRASVIKQSGRHSVPKMPKANTKKPVAKSSVSYKVSQKSYQFKQPQQKTVKAKNMTIRMKGLGKMKSNIAKSSPSPTIKMQKVKAAKKPPTKGRGR